MASPSSLREIAACFLRPGTVALGGPAAHVAMGDRHSRRCVPGRVASISREFRMAGADGRGSGVADARRGKKTTLPGSGFPLRAVCWFLSDDLYVLCLQALGPLGDRKRHGLAFLKALESVRLDCREVHENIVPGLAAVQAEALGIVKPFHCSLFHFCYLFLFLNFLLRRVVADERG